MHIIRASTKSIGSPFPLILHQRNKWVWNKVEIFGKCYSHCMSILERAELNHSKPFIWLLMLTWKNNFKWNPHGWKCLKNVFKLEIVWQKAEIMITQVGVHLTESPVVSAFLWLQSFYVGPWPNGQFWKETLEALSWAKKLTRSYFCTCSPIYWSGSM